VGSGQRSLFGVSAVAGEPPFDASGAVGEFVVGQPALLPVVVPLTRNARCERCALCRHATSRCLPGEGAPGGVLWVGEGPGPDEDNAGRVYASASGDLLRAIGERLGGPQYYTNAVRCYPGRARDIPPEAVEACRGYLEDEIARVRPRVIVAMGAVAFRALTGSPQSVRAVHGPTFAHRRPDGLPVYFVHHVAAALRSRQTMTWLLDDASRIPEVKVLGGDFALCVVEDPVEAEREVAAMAQRVRGRTDRAGVIGFDYECDGENPLNPWSANFTPLCLGMSSSDDRALVLVGRALRTPTLHAVFADPAVGKVAHDIKFDTQVGHVALGMPLRGAAGDTQAERYLRDTDAPYGLEAAQWHVGMGGHKEAFATHRKAAHVGKHYGRADPRKLLRYNGGDAVSTYRLWAHAAPDAIADNVWNRMLRPAVFAYAQMERNGVCVNRVAVGALRMLLRKRIEEAESRVCAFAQIKQFISEKGDDFNLDSNDQLRALLYDRLKLEAPEGRSVDKEALAALAGKHAVVKHLLEYKRLRRLESGYAGSDETRRGRKANNGILKHIGNDGRVHTRFGLWTAAGRTSSEDPNLQNIPRARTEEARMVKECFAPEPGEVLLSFDYAQIELRVAALLSQDPDMLAVFREGRDLHAEVAALVHNCAVKDVTNVQRDGAKVVNFGVWYGKTVHTLALDLGISDKAAQRIYDAVLTRYPRAAAYREELQRQAREEGHIRTWWDGAPFRIRYLPDADSGDRQRQSGAMNQAVNSPVQGTASDFKMASVIAIAQLVDEGLPARMVLEVHDDILFSARPEHAESVSREVCAAMLSWNSAGVPLAVDAKVGASWGTLKKYAKADSLHGFVLTAT